MEPNPMSLPPIWTVTRSVSRCTAFSCGSLVPCAFHISAVVAPLQLTSLNAVPFGPPPPARGNCGRSGRSWRPPGSGCRGPRCRSRRAPRTEWYGRPHGRVVRGRRCRGGDDEGAAADRRGDRHGPAAVVRRRDRMRLTLHEVPPQVRDGATGRARCGRLSFNWPCIPVGRYLGPEVWRDEFAARRCHGSRRNSSAGLVAGSRPRARGPLPAGIPTAGVNALGGGGSWLCCRRGCGGTRSASRGAHEGARRSVRCAPRDATAPDCARCCPPSSWSPSSCAGSWPDSPWRTASSAPARSPAAWRCSPRSRRPWSGTTARWPVAGSATTRPRRSPTWMWKGSPWPCPGCCAGTAGGRSPGPTRRASPVSARATGWPPSGGGLPAGGGTAARRGDTDAIRTLGRLGTASPSRRPPGHLQPT